MRINIYNPNKDEPNDFITKIIETYKNDNFEYIFTKPNKSIKK